MSDRFLDRVSSFLKRQRRALKRARAGNVAIIFALSIIPVLVTGGAGIDLARALAVRSRMYEAVDAAALAVASKSGITQAQAQILAQQYFNANFTLNSSYGTPSAVTVTVNGQQVDVSSNIQMPTTIMSVAGFQHVNLSAASTVVWGQTKIWVGLALDTTGSMCEPTGSQPCTNPANSKIAAMKTATHSLLTLFQNASATAGDVQVSLIPFAQQVNVGTANSGASWIDWTSWDISHPGTCYVNGSANASFVGEAACTGAGTCTINGQATSHTSQTACNAASGSACYVNGTPNTQYGSQTACNGIGSCSVGSYTSQSTCQNAGTCSISGYTSQSTCLNAGTCTIAGNTTRNSCESAYTGVCSLAGYTTRNSCENAGTCSISGYTSKSSCESAYNGYVCRINGVNYNGANYDTRAECETSANGVCSKTPASTYNTRTKCRANPNPGTWYVGVWTGVNGRGVWTPAVWSNQYGVWTSTPGTWTWGVWTASPGTWTQSYGVWTPATTTSYTPNRSGWTGCIADRGLSAGPATSTTSGYDVVNTAPGSTAESKFPAVSSNDCPTSMLSLGYDWTTLTNKVDALVARGYTNQTIGMAWAWHSISQGAPLSPPSLPSGTTRHIIILSDGENTRNRWYTSNSNGRIDDRMNMVCDNAKNDGVIIWSVFVNIAGTAGDASSMEDCATGGANGGPYIEVTSTGGIGAAFNVIGQQITNLRVAH
jgi:Flp pilus assembly protein TadG